MLIAGPGGAGLGVGCIVIGGWSGAGAALPTALLGVPAASFSPAGRFCDRLGRGRPRLADRTVGEARADNKDGGAGVAGAGLDSRGSETEPLG